MKLPLEFKASAHTISGIQNTWTVESYNHKIQCAIPPEFSGPGGGLSPEDLFAQALTNCLIATFKVYAENSRLTFDKLNVETHLCVDQNENKKTVMKSCKFHVQIQNPSSADKAQILIQKAFDSGFILNSVKTELSYELAIG